MPAIIDQASPPSIPVRFDGTTEEWFNYDARNISAPIGAAFVRGGLQAGMGLIPAGKLPVLVHADGSAISGLVMQYDKLSTAPDKSTLCLRWAVMNPEAITAANARSGARLSYKWTLQAVPRNTTAKITTDDIKARTDYKVKVSGGNLDSSYTWSVNDILANGVGGAAPANWGRSPLRSWEVTESGPVCTSLRLRGYLKRDTDGAFHGWATIEGFLTFWHCDSGAIQAHGWFRAANSNVLGPVSGSKAATASTKGTAVIQGIWELYNGSSRVTASDFLGVIGGPLDDRTRSLTGLVSSNGGLVTTALLDGHAYQVTSSNSVPGGLISGGIYWVRFDGTRAYFYTNRNDAFDAGLGISENKIETKSAGSGTLTFTIMGSVADGCGFTMVTTDGEAEPIWLGTGIRPAKIGRIRDKLQYLRGTPGLTLPADPTLRVNFNGTVTGASYTGGRSNNQVIASDINTTGDGASDRRIGETDVINKCWIFEQTSLGYMRSSRLQAIDWADYQCHYVDETSGRRTVGNGGTYIGLGASRDNMNYLMGHGYGGFAGSRSNGYAYRYGSAVDGSHMPVFGKYPYAYWGDDIYLEMLLDQVGSLAMAYARDQVGPSQTWRSTSTHAGDQPRGAAWATWAFVAARILCPDNHPEKQHYVACLMSTGAMLKDMALNAPVAQRNLGMLLQFYKNEQGQHWMICLWYAACSIICWSGLVPDINTAFNTTGYKAVTNYALPEFGGRMHEYGLSLFQYADGPNNISNGFYPSFAAMWAHTQSQNTANGDQSRYLAGGNDPSYPDRWADSLGNATKPESLPSFAGPISHGNDPTDWTNFGAGALAAAKIAGFTNSLPAWERMKARMDRNGGVNNNDYPQFSCLPW